MDDIDRSSIFYTLFKQDGWSFYLAATQTGLCFTGSLNGSVDELKRWMKKRSIKEFKYESEKTSVYSRKFKEYFEGRRREFTLPVDIQGTPFQLLVWEQLKKIPYGKTMTYGEIAQAIERPRAARAVGTAVGQNPLLITIPCHRVLRKDGAHSNYRGSVLMKELLLNLEFAYSQK